MNVPPVPQLGDLLGLLQVDVFDPGAMIEVVASNAYVLAVDSEKLIDVVAVWHLAACFAEGFQWCYCLQPRFVR